VKILLLEPAESEPDSTAKTQKIHFLLKQLGYEVVEQSFSAALYETVKTEKPDVVFNLASIYEWNKTNLIPAILEIADVRYTGSGMLSLSLARYPTKLFPLLYKSGVTVVPFKIMKAGSAIQSNKLHYPLNLRPDGSRHNLALANVKELRGALKELPSQEELVLQEHIDGEMVNLYILDSVPFPSLLNEPYLAPAIKAYQLIEARGLVRFDFIMSDEPLLSKIEVSPDPLDKKLLQVAAVAGWNEEKIIQSLVEHAGRD